MSKEKEISFMIEKDAEDVIALVEAELLAIRGLTNATYVSYPLRKVDFYTGILGKIKDRASECLIKLHELKERKERL